MERNKVEIRGLGAESSGLPNALTDAFAEVGFPVEVRHVDRVSGVRHFQGLEILLTVPAAILFKKFMESAANDAHKQMKAWVARLFAQVRAETNVEHIVLSTRDLNLLEDDEPGEAAYRELIAILRGNPNLRAWINWLRPTDPDGYPLAGASYRWEFMATYAGD
jgi:hypothetical protein